VFSDEPYNRTAFYLVGRDATSMVSAVRDCCDEAFSSIPFNECGGTHPTLGSVDHVVFSPLVAGAEAAAQMDSQLARIEGVADDFARQVHDEYGVCVYRYGARSKPLKEIRRSLGYFDKTVSSSSTLSSPWAQNLEKKLSSGDADLLEPDFGSFFSNGSDEGNTEKQMRSTIREKGVMCVGSIPLVLNLNIRFREGDAKRDVMQVTQHVRVPNLVEALTLQHQGGSWEVACNLKNYSAREGGVEAVMQRVRDKVAELGGRVEVAESYTTGPTVEELLQTLGAQE